MKHPQGSQAPDKQTLESGTRVTVTTGFNRPWIDWVVSDCVPGEFIVLRAERTGWLDGYHMVVRSDLETLDDEKCHLKVKLYVMFLNRGLEIASLFLPFGFLYSMCINSAIKKTKNSIERT
ncbi:MAG: hypothetical protein COB53_12455 [Elusimicrobia bacterium]|nr:MAG: hypothetical protein COB53_12455 [Elusimicrobiota bacterium]